VAECENQSGVHVCVLPYYQYHRTISSTHPQALRTPTQLQAQHIFSTIKNCSLLECFGKGEGRGRGFKW